MTSRITRITDTTRNRFTRVQERANLDYRDLFAWGAVICLACAFASLLDDNAWAWLVFGIFFLLVARTPDRPKEQ